MLIWVSAMLLTYVNFDLERHSRPRSWFGEAEPDAVLVPVSRWRTAMVNAPPVP
jgi:hypothetical protein